MKKKLVFIRVWPSPPIAASVERLLVTSFPEYQVETIDIIKLIKHRKDILLRNAFATLWQYGPHSLFKADRFKVVYFGTPYLFHTVRDLLRERLSGEREQIAFTFQLQSLFDASQPGIPHFVYTDHTMLENLHYASFDRRKLYSPTWIDLERSIYQNAACVFTRSQNISRSLFEEYNCSPEKVLCVYAGSNVQVDAESLNNDGYKNKNILFVGTNWQFKGGPILEEAFRTVLQVHPDARLTIVGCSPQISHPQIEVVGRIPVEEVSHYYQRASIFCLPTLVEAFGVVFVEALSYRLPVVATEIGATPDFILEGENGYLVKPMDSQGLAQALLKLVGDAEKCRVFGERSRRLAEERYNWESVGKAIRQRVLAELNSS